MAPKTSKGKGAAKDAGGKEAPESELAEMRTQYALFTSMVDALTLKEKFRPLWGRETSGHPAKRVIPASCAKAGPKWYPFFADYFSCGLCPLSLISSMTSCTPPASVFWILR